jgi:hypothetical protein
MAAEGHGPTGTAKAAPAAATVAKEARAPAIINFLTNLIVAPNQTDNPLQFID